MNHEFITFDELVDEITDFTGLDKEDVKKRVWAEVLNPGWNVERDARKRNIDFHIYNKKMEEFYKESYGFIFETSVEACRTGKQRVLEMIVNRINNYLDEKNKINILMLGDGIGHDTTFLYEHFNNRANFFYFDVPGSKTYDFAIKWFKKYNTEVNLINDYDKIPFDFFDVIVCLEVLEHLPNPIEAIEDLHKFLKINGIVLLTESFGAVSSNFPTHLLKNRKYCERTPFLFLKSGLILNYYSKVPFLFFRPTEYIKKKNVSFKDKLRLYLDRPVFMPYLISYFKKFR